MVARRHLRRAAVIAAGVALLTGVGLAIWWLSPGRDFSTWREGAPPRTWASWLRQEELWTEERLDRSPQHDYRPLAELGPRVPLAVLVSEDISFLDHGTVDMRAVWEAVSDWVKGARLRGASTISQQLARILFLSPERSLSRKLNEVRLAWWLEHSLGKRRILELYLNTVEFGPGLFGAEAAALHYYGAPASSLTAEAAAGLAAAIPSPGRDNPFTATARWRLRRDLILRRMAHATQLRLQLSRMTGAGAEAGDAGGQSAN